MPTVRTASNKQAKLRPAGLDQISKCQEPHWSEYETLFLTSPQLPTLVMRLIPDLLQQGHWLYHLLKHSRSVHSLWVSVIPVKTTFPELCRGCCQNINKQDSPVPGLNLGWGFLILNTSSEAVYRLSERCGGAESDDCPIHVSEMIQYD